MLLSIIYAIVTSNSFLQSLKKKKKKPCIPKRLLYFTSNVWLKCPVAKKLTTLGNLIQH